MLIRLWPVLSQLSRVRVWQCRSTLMCRVCETITHPIVGDGAIPTRTNESRRRAFWLSLSKRFDAGSICEMLRLKAAKTNG